MLFDSIPRQMPRNDGFNHGFKVVRTDFVHPQLLLFFGRGEGGCTSLLSHPKQHLVEPTQGVYTGRGALGNQSLPPTDLCPGDPFFAFFSGICATKSPRGVQKGIAEGKKNTGFVAPVVSHNPKQQKTRANSELGTISISTSPFLFRYTSSPFRRFFLAPSLHQRRLVPHLPPLRLRRHWQRWALGKVRVRHLPGFLYLARRESPLTFRAGGGDSLIP